MGKMHKEKEQQKIFLHTVTRFTKAILAEMGSLKESETGDSRGHTRMVLRV